MTEGAFNMIQSTKPQTLAYGLSDSPSGLAAWLALFRDSPVMLPRKYAERSLRIERWSQMPRGGHFAAWEEPELYAREIREFFRPLRDTARGCENRKAGP